MAFVPGAKTTFDGSNDHILDLKMGLDFLNPKQDGIALLKRLGTNGFTAKAVKTEWTETALAPRGESVTVDNSQTTMDVADAYIYQVNELIRIENEVVRVTAIADADTLTITRGYGGTSAAAHTAKLAYSLGSADPENSTAPAGVADSAVRLYNYVQTFTRSVNLSADEIANLSTEGNPLTGQVKRRFIEINRQLARAVLYGVRHEDSTNKIHTMGGLATYITTNVHNAAGAISIAIIDARILAIVNAGGDPNVMVMSPTVKQKLDALDANIVRQIGKTTAQSHIGGNPDTQTWQSGVLDHTLEIIVDHSILTDELWILDTSSIEVGHLSNNGVNGAFHVEDATTPGQDGTKKVIRGKYSLRVLQEKNNARIYGIT